MIDHSADPIAQFLDWYAQAPSAAMTLATVDDTRKPRARVVLLKGADARGFTFYTNLGSPKARHLSVNPYAALCFHWPDLGRQVLVQGKVERVSEEESDAYFATRPRESQLGAWASRQSEPMNSREELLARTTEMEARFTGREVPRPPFWGGFRLIPDQIEFWEERPHRLHDRLAYQWQGERWQSQRLYP